MQLEKNDKPQTKRSDDRINALKQDTADVTVEGRWLTLPWCNCCCHTYRGWSVIAREHEQAQG